MRGHVEIYPREDGGFDVYDWAEHYHSGCLIGAFDTRHEAIAAARGWAKEHGRKFASAEVVALRTEGD